MRDSPSIKVSKLQDMELVKGKEFHRGKNFMVRNSISGCLKENCPSTTEGGTKFILEVEFPQNKNEVREKMIVKMNALKSDWYRRLLILEILLRLYLVRIELGAT